MEPKTYTVKQVANLPGFSTNTVYRYLDEGKVDMVDGKLDNLQNLNLHD